RGYSLLFKEQGERKI
ncbi:hypothetical protein CP8484711_0612B, partial [Chlamydia psittaci 84-8471/1]